MKRLAVVGLVVVLSLLMAGVAFAGHDIGVSGDYWVWDLTNNQNDITVEGHSLVLEANIDLRPKVTGRITGIFGNVESIDGRSLDSGVSAKPESFILSLHYWFHENFNINLGYTTRNSTLYLNNYYIDDEIELYKFEGVRYGIGFEKELKEKLLVFADLGYVPEVKATFFDYYVVEDNKLSMSDFKLGISYEFKPDFFLRGGYLIEKLYCEDISWDRSGFFVGVSYEF